MKVVVGNNFDEIVLNESKDVLLEVCSRNEFSLVSFVINSGIEVLECL